MYPEWWPGWEWGKGIHFTWCVWFVGSVNSEVFVEQVLMGTVWPAVKSLDTKRQYYFQQDDASCFVTAPCLQLLGSTSVGTESRNTWHHWDPHSPDLSSLNFLGTSHDSFMQTLTNSTMKIIANDFAAKNVWVKVLEMAARTKIFGGSTRSPFRAPHRSI